MKKKWKEKEIPKPKKRRMSLFEQEKETGEKLVEANRPIYNSDIIEVDQKLASKYEGYGAIPNTVYGETGAKLYELFLWPKIDLQDVEQLEERLREYLAWSFVRNVPVSNRICYMALGVSNALVSYWESGQRGTKEHTEFVLKMKEIIAAHREALTMEGKVPARVGIFWAKNYDGMKDTVETIIKSPDPLEDAIDITELRKRYLDED